MQVSGIGKIGELVEDLGDAEEGVFLTGGRDDLKRAAPHFLSQVVLVSPSQIIAIREAAERRDMDAIFALTQDFA